MFTINSNAFVPVNFLFLPGTRTFWWIPMQINLGWWHLAISNARKGLPKVYAWMWLMHNAIIGPFLWNKQWQDKFTCAYYNNCNASNARINHIQTRRCFSTSPQWCLGFFFIDFLIGRNLLHVWQDWQILAHEIS